jgi:Domain of unknown function (DUF4126)
MTALGTALGLGLASGLSLYGAAFLTGLAIHLGWAHVDPAWAALRVLADPPVLVLTGALFLLEFFADKIPWVDSVWDVLHTVIRPIGGALLALRALGHVDPTVEVVAFLLLGGVILTTHAAKASLRLLVNLSPEPVSNVVVSLAENGLLVGAVWLALAHPVTALAVSALALVVAIWVVVTIGRGAVRVLRRRGWRSTAASGSGSARSAS